MPAASRLTRRVRRLPLTLAVGGAGSALFLWLGLPVAWMLGAMTATTIAAVGGLPVALPRPLRQLMVAVLGVMLGSAFTPVIIERLPLWTGSLAALFLYVAVATILVQTYYRRLAGYSPTTAYFAAAPGGLSVMTLMGGAMGGDERAISMSQATRVLTIVLVLPVLFRIFVGYQPPVGQPASHIAAIAPLDLLILFLCGVIGYFVAGRMRLPAAELVGPLLLSAAAHLSGLTRSHPPAQLAAAAQLIVGVSIGVRFAGLRVTEILRAAVLASGAAALLLVTTGAFAAALHGLMGVPIASVILAFAPGGVAEMSLVALSLGIDVAYVATHHIVRIFIIVAAAPVVFRLLRRRQDSAGEPPEAGEKQQVD